MNRQCKYVYEDNNRVRTSCTHTVHNRNDYCIFHVSVNAKNPAIFKCAFDDLIEKLELGDYESIDLRGFKFPDFDYHGKTFKKALDLRRAEFSGNLNFEHVIFEGPVDFFKVTFHGLVNFQCAVFNRSLRDIA